MKKLKNLAVRLLDDEHGITEKAYLALLDMLSEKSALKLNKHVKAMEGRFYLPKYHELRAWKA